MIHPVERKQQATFFAPPALVEAVLREALACDLEPKLGQSEAAVENSLVDPDAELRHVLLDVTMLDPGRLRRLSKYVSG